MDTRLPTLYKEYGIYSNWRNLPSEIDGLKPVERRVLLSAYKIARNKFVKSRQVDAYTIGHYHPHGECYGTIVQLVKQGLLVGQGNFGSNVGIEPVGAAAPRYTECKINQKIIDMMFKYINYVPVVNTELGDEEPAFLPTMFPVCLIGTEYSQGIGFGYKTFIPCYTKEDLYKRLQWLLGIRKTKPTINPISDCDITSNPKDLELLLTTGKSKINVSGKFEINPVKNIVVLKSWPPGKRFESLLNKFSSELTDNMIGFTDLSSTETKIVFQVLRERNRDKIFKSFVEKLKVAVQGTISFDTAVITKEQKVITKPIDTMLMDTFKIFCDVNEVMLNQELEVASKKIEELNILETIRPVLSECIKTGLDVKSTIIKVSKQTAVKEKVVEELINKYKISKLLSLSTDTSYLKEKIEYLTKNLKNIQSFVLEQYNELYK